MGSDEGGSGRADTGEELQLGDERFRGIMDSLLEGCQIIAKDWRYLYINPAAERHNRRSKEDLIGRRYMDMWPGIESTHVFQVIRQCLEEDIPRTMENEFKFPDGAVGWFELRIQPVPEGVFILSIDVTARKMLEIETNARHIELEQLFNHSNAGLVLFDATPPYRVLAHNRSYQEFFAEPWMSQGMKGKSVLDYAPGAEAAGIISTIEKVLATRQQVNLLDFPYNSKPPRKSWYNWHLSPIIIDGKVTALSSLSVDVMKQHEAEQSLLESEEKFRRIVESAQEGIMMASAEGIIVYSNDRMAEMLGYGAGELIGRPGIELLADGADLARVRGMSKKRESGIKEHYEIIMRRKDGGKIWLMASGTPVHDDSGRHVGNLGMYVDITERKKGEEELERARGTLAEAQRIAHLGSFEYIAATQTTSWSEEEYHIYGLDPSEPSPAYDAMLQKCIHPDDAAMLHDTFSRAIQKRSVYELEHRILRPDGSVRWVYDRAHPYFDEKGNLSRYVGATLDITERKIDEEHLKIVNRRLALALKSARAGSWDWDMVTGKLVWSAEMFSIFGLDPSKDDATFDTWKGALHPDDVATASARIDAAVRDHTMLDNEYRIAHANGDVRWINAVGESYYDGDGKPVRMSGLCYDITERKRGEEALRATNEELSRFNRAMIGRELKMVEMKKEVNELLRRLGEPPRYALDRESIKKTPQPGGQE